MNETTKERKGRIENEKEECKRKHSEGNEKALIDE